MKTSIIRFGLLVTALFTLGNTQAAEPLRFNDNAKRNALERNLDRALNKHLAYPIAAKSDMTGDVYISFVIDKEGRVEVLECNSTNERLRDYVLRKLAHIDIGENPDGVWRTTHMRIVFRPERDKA